MMTRASAFPRSRISPPSFRSGFSVCRECRCLRRRDTRGPAGLPTDGLEQRRVEIVCRFNVQCRQAFVGRLVFRKDQIGKIADHGQGRLLGSLAHGEDCGGGQRINHVDSGHAQTPSEQIECADVIVDGLKSTVRERDSRDAIAQRRGRAVRDQDTEPLRREALAKVAVDGAGEGGEIRSEVLPGFVLRPEWLKQTPPPVGE